MVIEYWGVRESTKENLSKRIKSSHKGGGLRNVPKFGGNRLI